MPVATHSQLKPALSTVNRPRRHAEVSRSTAAWSPPNPGSSKFAIVQALAFPPVRLPWLTSTLLGRLPLGDAEHSPECWMDHDPGVLLYFGGRYGPSSVEIQ